MLGLPVEEISYARRGFRGATDQMRARLEQVGASFRDGYQAALDQGKANGLDKLLEVVSPELRGFAFEGAAMGLALLDRLTPWRPHRLSDFMDGAGEPHIYMVHVGVGWVWARWPLRAPQPSQREKRQLDPVLLWLGYDGWGFHEGFFHWPKYMGGAPAPRSLEGYQRRVFDQGLGRSFWFVNGGNPGLIAGVIEAFAWERQADLWSGVGLAATYAGMVDRPILEQLRDLASPHWPHLAQGSAFAAKARARAGNSTDYTELAVRALCDISAEEAARLCDSTLRETLRRQTPNTKHQTPLERQAPKLANGANEAPVYEEWRRRIQEHFAQASSAQSDRSENHNQANCAHLHMTHGTLTHDT
ncbi:MAG: hypothetical protein C5B50_26070 [Verrucomicrobia bacterium]|nr:MAG: hypothetical protein C5B50_26070 [Verrucomicrobiota bacterium]